MCTFTANFINVKYLLFMRLYSCLFSFGVVICYKIFTFVSLLTLLLLLINYGHQCLIPIYCLRYGFFHGR